MRLTFGTYRSSFMRFQGSLGRGNSLMLLRLELLMSCEEFVRILHVLGWHDLVMVNVSGRDWMLLSRFGCLVNWCSLMYWRSMVHWNRVMDNRSLYLGSLLGRRLCFHKHLEVLKWSRVYGLMVRFGPMVFL